MESTRAIGLMSGTSLDGIDVAACEFTLDNGKWSFHIHHAKTFPYSGEWASRLTGLHSANALEFARTHAEYGHLLGLITREFIGQTGFNPELIASHGHTVFHQPTAGFTVQIGDGSAIAAETQLPVICDFRAADVALGGQGAPLVPMGDRLLFADFDACLNLGGFANISVEKRQERVAFDICPVNIVLNRLANSKGLACDHDGIMAASGNVDQALLDKLNCIPYYSLPYPKSLGREWLEQEFLPALEISGLAVEDKIRTVCEHVACQVNLSLDAEPGKKVLVTGGGAWNKFLMKTIRNPGTHQFIIPDPLKVDFKEALIFAFLGVLRWRGEHNVLRSVTGSQRNHSGGALWNPIPPPPLPDAATA